MHTTKQVAQFLKDNNNYVIIPHRSPDGDCLGSSSALLLALRALGKNAKIVLPSPVTQRLSFIWDSSFEEGSFEPEVAIAVDVAASYMMLELYDDVFCKAKTTVCIDHHGTNEGFADVNCVDPSAAAAGEIMCAVVDELGVELTKEIAERLFVAIADDTGGFQYSNTTTQTHRAASQLYGAGINSADIMRALFATRTKAEMNLLKFVTAHMEYHFGGRVCTTWIDQDSLNQSGAEMSNADAWIGLTRSVDGVEVGLMFKVLGENETRVSLRSNNYVDVASVAAKFGGGGHIRAAGVTFLTNLETAKESLLSELEKLV